jgi:hypothetical protein
VCCWRRALALHVGSLSWQCTLSFTGISDAVFHPKANHNNRTLTLLVRSCFLLLFVFPKLCVKLMLIMQSTQNGIGQAFKQHSWRWLARMFQSMQEEIRKMCYCLWVLLWRGQPLNSVIFSIISVTIWCIFCFLTYEVWAWRLVMFVH